MMCSRCHDKRISFFDFLRIYKLNSKNKEKNTLIPYECSKCGKKYIKRSFPKWAEITYLLVCILIIFICRGHVQWIKNTLAIITSYVSIPAMIIIYILGWFLIVFLVPLIFAVIYLLINWLYTIKPQ